MEGSTVDSQVENLDRADVSDLGDVASRRDRGLWKT